MCPNHIEPILDRYLSKKNKYSTSERVKIYRHYSEIEHNTIIQEFIHMRKTRKYLLSNTIDNHRLERIDTSQIPKIVEQYYYDANKKFASVNESLIENNEEKEECIQVIHTKLN